LELHPTWFNPGIWSSADKIALSYLHQGKYSQAETTALSNYEKSKTNGWVLAVEVLGDVQVGLGRLDRAVDCYEEAAQIYSSQKTQMDHPILLKAAQIYFEQQKPEAALALGLRHTSPWAAGVRGMAQLLLKNEAAAEKEFASLRASLIPSIGDYMAGKRVELHRLLAAFYAGRSLEVIAGWPQVGGALYHLYALEVGRAYLEAGMPSEAELHLRLTIKAQQMWSHPAFSADFLSYMLGKFYLGKLLEQTGKKAEAISAYQEFLSHFENSFAKLPQIAEARTALKRLL
jgi:tetratricopeptide (TPR) repeat protein